MSRILDSRWRQAHSTVKLKQVKTRSDHSNMHETDVRGTRKTWFNVWITRKYFETCLYSFLTGDLSKQTGRAVPSDGTKIEAECIASQALCASFYL